MDIGDLTNQGVGVGRVDGWVVMVALALPGERVRARVFRNHGNYSEADLVDVLERSADRVEPVCPLFGRCGGCQYQNLAYPAQLDWKRRQIESLFDHHAGIRVAIDPVVPSPRAYGYRTKLTPHYDKPRGGVVGPIGFLVRGRRFDLVDVGHCPIGTEGINRALPGFRERVRREAAGRRKGATLLLRDAGDGVTDDPRAVITERVGDLTLRFEAGTFFQNNPFLLPALVDHVRAEACGDGVTRLVDAYCGCGLFALACARECADVIGVELSRKSIAWARENAEANGLGNCAFQAADAADVFAGIPFDPKETAVIIDPPRRGCDAVFLDQLFGFRPRRVVYVSCNPATQLRDLARFLGHGYRPGRVRPFDMFPQTKHLECVMTLVAED